MRVPLRTLSVSEFQCSLPRGAPRQAEQFTQPSISIVTAGVFGFRSGSDDQLLTTGSLMLANPGQQYEISHEHQGGDRCLVFHFDDAVLDEVAEGMTTSHAGPRFRRSALPPLPSVAALQQLAQLRLGAADAPLGMDELGISLASLALEHAGPSRPRRRVRADRRGRDAIHDSLARLARSFAEPIGLEDLAREAGMGRHAFLRLFQQQLGVTPYRFLVQARIRRAVVLLRETTAPVTEIALDVGFSDLSNFINLFRREVGYSPLRFRKLKPRECRLSAP